MEITSKNRATPIVRTSKTMRSIQLKSLLLGVLIWFGCDQNLRPLPVDTGQASRSALLEQQTAFVSSNGGSVSGTIDITPELFARLRGSETLYIMARRDETGPPVAVQRMKRLQFPMTYTLTGTDQMVQGLPFSGEVSIVARIDLDGNAGVPQAGDMEGVIPRVVIGNTGADVVIDKLY